MVDVLDPCKFLLVMYVRKCVERGRQKRSMDGGGGLERVAPSFGVKVGDG